MLSAQDKWDNGKLSVTSHWLSCQYILSSTNPCTISLVEWGELYSKLNTAIGQAPKDLRSSAQLAQISPPPLMQTCLLALPCHSEIPPTKWSWERRATLWANCLCIDSRTGTTNRPSPAFVQNLILPLNQVFLCGSRSHCWSCLWRIIARKSGTNWTEASIPREKCTSGSWYPNRHRHLRMLEVFLGGNFDLTLGNWFISICLCCPRFTVRKNDVHILSVYWKNKV